MRKVFSIALIATLAFVFVQSANAGTTIDVIFNDAISPTGITILPGDAAAPGCTFTGYYGRTVSTGRCMDVILKTTDPLIGFSARVGYDSDNGLAVGSFYEWLGVGVSFNAKGTLQKSCILMDGITDNGLEVGKFDCAIPPPNAPPSLAPGTYRIGTIVWDTSGTTSGTETISVLITGVGAVINGIITNVNATVVSGSHIIVIPEPGTASLLGLGFIGLILAGRRSRA
jgi:hypothetical protein